MSEQSQHLKVTAEGDVAVAELRDRKILDEVYITEIGNSLNELARPGCKLVLDFQNVSNMSSSALGMLITLHKRVREREGQLRLCSIQPAIMEVFEITRLNEIFHICSSRAEAIQSLA
jgi:anti-sigma B factor antagonist